MRKRFTLLMSAACIALATNAQQNYEVGDPNKTGQEYLQQYKPLKEYIDREAYPNFKLGLALGAQDYIDGKTVKAVADNYFDEVVTGNAMKMASVVNGNGDMNFNTVKNFVKKATAAGLNIYGHTLAWHAQQPKGWLTRLIADRTMIVPNEDGSTTWNAIAEKDFRKQQSVGWTGDQEKFGFSFKYSNRDGMIVTCTKKVNKWDVQYIAMSDIPCVKGETYKMVIRVKARKNPDDNNTGTINAKLGDWGSGPNVSIPFTDEWQEVEVLFKNAIGPSFLLLQHGDFVGDIMISDISISHEDAGPIVNIPLTAEEKHDTLVWAMDKWIKGMMEATDGNVKAWDLANEAISGGDSDGDGVYDLQHDLENKSENDFFWQDHMGDLEYIRQAVRLARKYYAEVMEKHGGDDGKLTLFINDYNLESTWDNNAKVKAMVKWIERWEADGVTHIDGIGSQMHISCSMDDNELNTRKRHIENSFKIMAASGKLVRISEFDMGMDKGGMGSGMHTDQLTPEAHKRMADYYEWIVKKYFEIIPPEQQWGICQWCATDSPANSGWRKNEPVGLWTLDWYRKPAYAGVAQGLGAPDYYTAIEEIEAETESKTPAVSLQGIPVNENYNGVVIVGGKKILRK